MLICLADGNRKGEDMALYTTSNQAAGIEQKVFGSVKEYAGSTAPTHEDTDCKGGYQCVASATARGAIPAYKREAGMIVFQQNSEKEYKLEANLTTWTEITVGQVAPIAASLYTYTQRATVNSQREHEIYKWHDGRLEVKMRRDSVWANIGSGNIWTKGYNTAFFYDTSFIATPVGSVGSRDGSGGINWGTLANVGTTSYNANAMASSKGESEIMVVFVGRWK